MMVVQQSKKPRLQRGNEHDRPWPIRLFGVDMTAVRFDLAGHRSKRRDGGGQRSAMPKNPERPLHVGAAVDCEQFHLGVKRPDDMGGIDDLERWFGRWSGNGAVA